MGIDTMYEDSRYEMQDRNNSFGKKQIIFDLFWGSSITLLLV
jgi:hypothetical protein